MRLYSNEQSGGLSAGMRCASGLLLLFALAATAAQPWNRTPDRWTVEDARHILLDSPWAEAASASFGHELTPEDIPPARLPGAAEAGIAGPRPNSGAGWDGGPGRDRSGEPPKLPVLVRWDSATPVREAMLKLPAGDRKNVVLYTAAQAERDYILTVTGLVPAGRYKEAGQLPKESRSSGDENGSPIDPQDPEELLEGVMATSRLVARDQPAIRPEDVKLDADTGALHLFFSRERPIRAEDKEVTFATQFGSMKVTRKFRLKEMMYGGRLEL